MPLVKILQNYENAEGWKPGDVVDVSDPWTLISQNKAALVDGKGNIISRDKSLAQDLIEKLGREEALLLAFDIMKKFPPEEVAPAKKEEAESKSDAKVVEVKEEESKTKTAPKKKGRPAKK